MAAGSCWPSVAARQCFGIHQQHHGDHGHVDGDQWFGTMVIVPFTSVILPMLTDQDAKCFMDQTSEFDWIALGFQWISVIWSRTHLDDGLLGEIWCTDFSCLDFFSTGKRRAQISLQLSVDRAELHLQAFATATAFSANFGISMGIPF